MRFAGANRLYLTNKLSLCVFSVRDSNHTGRGLASVWLGNHRSYAVRKVYGLRILLSGNVVQKIYQHS